MKAVTFYTGLLQAAGVTIGTNGELLLSQGGIEPTPLKVGTKIIALPNDANLGKGAEFWDHHVAFHPISQSLVRKESAIFKKLRQILNVRIYTNVMHLMGVMGELCSGGYEAADLTPEQLRLTADIAATGAVTDKTIACLTRVLNVASPEVSHRLVNIYMRKARNKDEKFSRCADVSFPIFDKYEGTKPKLFDVPINSMGSYRAILAMFRFIFPEADEPQKYSKGSMDLTAPSLEALLLAFGGLAEEMNRVIHMFSNLIPEHESLMIDLQWMTGLSDLAKYRMEIPAQSGNEGEPLDDHGSNMPMGQGNAPAPTPAVPALKSIAPMATNMQVPAIGTPTTTSAAPVVPASAPTPVLGVALPPETKKAPTLGVPLNSTTPKKETPSPFHQPVRATASFSNVRDNNSNMQAMQLQMQLEKERLQMQQQQLANGMMPQQNGLVPQQNLMVPQQNAMVPQQTVAPSAEFQTLMNALSASNPIAVQAINQNPQLAQILMTSPQACMAVMQNPQLLNNPAMLQQYVVPQVAAQPQVNTMQMAMMTGLPPGRQKAEQQKQQQALAAQQQLMQQQYAMQQNALSGMMTMPQQNVNGFNFPQTSAAMNPLLQNAMATPVTHTNGSSLAPMWK